MTTLHLIDVDDATRLLQRLGYRAERTPNGFTVWDADGKQVARCLVDINGLIARHAIKHLVESRP